jgi:membrane associated rhomboid family serine protease
MTPTPVGMRCPECARQRTRVVQGPRAMVGRPTATYALIAINVVMFVAQIATTGHGYGSLAGGTFTNKLELFGPAVADGEWWRLVTGGFLHAGFFHIAINMYILWLLGSMLEPAVGAPRFLLIYFVSLLAGSFGALLVTPHSPTVGASGAIFGVAGAAAVVGSLAVASAA